VLCFGRLRAYKGLDLLAEALRLMGPRPDMEVRVVGQGPESTALADLRALPCVKVENRWVPECEISTILNWAEMHDIGGLIDRQIGDDHVRSSNQPTHHLLSLGLHRIERDALFVSVDLQKQSAFATFADRRHKAIFAAVAFFHANDLGAKFGQQRRAIRPRDIAPEIQDAHALQNSPHRSFPLCFRQITGNGFRGKVPTDTMPLSAEVIAQWFD
jgi:glycosyltransferase involved in cell wall biosynthesis